MIELSTRPDHAPARLRRRGDGRWLSFGLKAVVSLGLLYVLSQGIRFEAVTETFASIRPVSVVLAGLLLIAVVTLGALRWSLIAERLATPLPLRSSIRISFEGLFFSQALPSTVGGDAVRAWRAASLGHPLSAVAAGVLLDRIVGLSGLILLVVASLPALAARMPEVELAGYVLILLASGAGAGAVLLALRSLPAPLRRSRAVALLVALSDAVWRTLAAPRTAGSTVLISLLIHVLTVLSVALLAVGLDVPIGLGDCFLIVPAALLAAAAPISIAGWGVRESAMMGGFALLGIGNEGDPLALSILFGGMLIVTSLPGGVLWLVVGAPAAHGDRSPEA